MTELTRHAAVSAPDRPARPADVPLAVPFHVPDAAGTAAEPTSVRWRIFAVIFALTVINLVDRTALPIAMPTIADDFALSATRARS